MGTIYLVLVYTSNSIKLHEFISQNLKLKCLKYLILWPFENNIYTTNKKYLITIDHVSVI